MNGAASTSIVLRRGRPEDAALLTELAASTFAETFEAMNTPEDFAAYTAGAFAEPVQRAELLDPEITVIFAERDGDTVGYAMLRDRRPPSSVGLDDALEIARLYARRHAVGTGVGAALMQHALAEAAARGKDAVWLGVWERNERALRFYETWGFYRCGTQPFLLGTDLQTDYVMVRRIARES